MRSMRTGGAARQHGRGTLAKGGQRIKVFLAPTTIVLSAIHWCGQDAKFTIFTVFT